MMMESLQRCTGLLGRTLGWEWTRLTMVQTIRFGNSVGYLYERWVC
jgi:hypothetical protein